MWPVLAEARSHVYEYRHLDMAEDDTCAQRRRNECVYRKNSLLLRVLKALSLMLHRASVHLAATILRPTSVRLQGSTACALRRHFKAALTLKSSTKSLLASSRPPLSQHQAKAHRKQRVSCAARAANLSSNRDPNSASSSPTGTPMEASSTAEVRSASQIMNSDGATTWVYHTHHLPPRRVACVCSPSALRCASVSLVQSWHPNCMNTSRFSPM